MFYSQCLISISKVQKNIVIEEMSTIAKQIEGAREQFSKNNWHFQQFQNFNGQKIKKT